MKITMITATKDNHKTIIACENIQLQDCTIMKDTLISCGYDKIIFEHGYPVKCPSCLNLVTVSIKEHSHQVCLECANKGLSIDLDHLKGKIKTEWRIL